MNIRHYRSLIVRAVLGEGFEGVVVANPELLGQLAVALSQAATGKQILRAKHYGVTGMSIDATASLVPDAKDYGG